MNKRLSVSILSSLVFSLAFVSACSSGNPAYSESPLPSNGSKYRTYYEIFPYAFADSDGDGIGDLKGITAKLDYISSLHYDGLWLTPVHQSDTYHKYDVDDYCSIDKKFGTLDDYDALVSGAHAKGMTILLDLVINHSSDTNPWFKACLRANGDSNPSSADLYYKNFYNIKPLTSSVVESNYQSAAGYGYPNLQYECVFWGEMPDLNLGEVIANPTGNLASELKKVVKFWLIDHQVDGFRLDAVTSYFGKSNSLYNKATSDFLKWLRDYCVSLKSDVYIVGEGDWDKVSTSYNKRMQEESGVDSFFDFGDQGSVGICYLLAGGSATNVSSAALLDYLKDDASTISSSGIAAPFIANHDTTRLYNSSFPNLGLPATKFANALLSFMKGSTFSYYGDEAGMICANSSNDPDKRQPMPWGDSYTASACPGTTVTADAKRYAYGTVAAQLADADSLPNYVKKCNYARGYYPAIARGETSLVAASSDKVASLFKKSASGLTDVYVAVNSNKKTDEVIDLSSGSYKLVVDLTTGKAASLSGGKLTLAPLSAAILL